jgi:hypothetical protein
VTAIQHDCECLLVACQEWSDDGLAATLHVTAGCQLTFCVPSTCKHCCICLNSCRWNYSAVLLHTLFGYRNLLIRVLLPLPLDPTKYT